MKEISYNSINDRIITEILRGKEEINLQKKIDKEEKEDKAGSFNKLVGNLTAMTLRKYITNIINYYGWNFKVSNTNAFIKGCPIEWDLIILRNNADDINKTNVFALDDVVMLFEFKTSGLRKNQYVNIDKTFEKQYKYIEGFREKGKDVVFAYTTFAESIEYYKGTKEYFDKMNNRNNTAFAFLEYYSLYNYDKKSYIEECPNFEKFLYELFFVKEQKKKKKSK